MLTKEQKEQFSEILEELGSSLDISETQFNAAVKSYEAVGSWLAKEDSALHPYKPQILPQGSFMLGTMIKPINDKDDLDIDLVCELTGKQPEWTQADLKKIVGNRLKAHEVYRDLLDDEGRRCWTLEYRKKSQTGDQYHMDILPSIISEGYSIILEKAFSAVEDTDFEKLAIRITDNQLLNYPHETNIEYWLKSNPFGFGRWFFNRASLTITKAFSLREAVKPVPKYQTDKLPLQRVVQILKRHRDMMFKGAENKPTSVIITTLAAKAYRKQVNITEALIDIVERMPLFIEERVNPRTGKKYRFIGNPVNESENFADRWIETPEKETNFLNWLKQVRKEVEEISELRGSKIQEALSKSFGEREVTKAFSNIGEKARILTEQGKNRFDTKLGIFAAAANSIKPHSFHGSED